MIHLSSLCAPWNLLTYHIFVLFFWAAGIVKSYCAPFFFYSMYESCKIVLYLSFFIRCGNPCRIVLYSVLWISAICYESGSADPYHCPSDTDPDPALDPDTALFVSGFPDAMVLLLITFLRSNSLHLTFFWLVDQRIQI